MTAGGRRRTVGRKGAVLRPVDLRRARLVRCYVERLLLQAESHLEEPQIASFQSFCDIWYGRYDWENPEELRSYKTLKQEQRREIFIRFLREYRSWEDTIRLSITVEPLGTEPRRASCAAAYEREQRRRRLQDLEERSERIHCFYERLAKEAEAQARALRLPWRIREAFHALGLPVGTPIPEVRRAFRQLAFQYHPDQRGDHAAMSDLNRAYRILVEYFRSGGESDELRS